jgi:AcrR family transcriptional regulator
MTREAQASQAATGRRPGRPRSAEAHQAIIAATLQVLMEQGFSGLSMERVAELAGVGKATIYRRWKGKPELVAEAITALRIEQPPPDEGSLRADLQQLARQQLEVIHAQPRFPRLAPLLLAESADDAELHGLVRANLVDPIRGMVAELVRRAMKRGELRRDLDVERVVDILHAPILYRFLILGADLSQIDETYTQSVLDIVLPGMAARKPPKRSRG